MAIPNNINREHVFQAIIRIKKSSIPNSRGAKKYVLVYEEEKFPCKLLISYANYYANGEELNCDPTIFQTEMAIRYLTSIGFKISSLS